MPKTEVFLSLCAENDFKFWRLNNDEKKITLLHNFKMEKIIQNIMIVNYDLDFEKTEPFLKLTPYVKRKQRWDRFLIVFD